MRNFVKPGEVITLTAPSGGVVSGTGYKIGSIFGVACADVAETLPFEAAVEGVFDLPKTTGTAWTEGVLLYWDDSTHKATTVAAANILIGTANVAAGSSDATGRVRLNGAATDSAAAGSVATADLAAQAVTYAKAALFISTEQTGNGSSQNIAHGLGTTPTHVFVAPTDTSPSTAGVFTVTEGSHDATNVVVTVTSGKKYKVQAWA